MTLAPALLTAPATHNPADCARVAPILARIGDKWTVLVVMVLAAGPLRFNELRRRVGKISQRMLTFTVRGLERDGLLQRTVYQAPQTAGLAGVEYALTPLGHSLLATIEPLGQWARGNAAAVENAQQHFDSRQKS